MKQRKLATFLALVLAMALGGPAVAQVSARRAAMWDAYQAARPTADKTWTPAVIAYELAAQSEIKASNKANIAEERKSAKNGGGVVNLAAMHQYQERVREADAEIARIKGLAKSMGIKAPAATSAPVQTVANCIRTASDSTLRDERTFSAEDAKGGTCFWLYLLHCEIAGDGESVRGWMTQTFGRAR